MESRPEDNLKCPICFEIFQDPVILWCSHSFCRGCLQRWWTETTVKCPVCRTTFLQGDPPQNLALKNLCDAFLLERTGTLLTGSPVLCSLHKETLKLFCVDHLEPVCVVCLHSETHRNHKFKPINEAAQCYKEGLRKLLKPLQEKRELLNNIKDDFDQTAEDIEVQAQDTERQIKDVFLMLQKFLQREERARIGSLREEKQRKSQMMKRKTEALSREIATLSGTIRATEEALAAENIPFLQNYSTAAEGVRHSIPDVEELTSEALIDMDKHLSNLSFAILDRMREMIFSSFKPELSQYSPKYLQAPGYYSVHPLTQTRRPFSLALPESQARELNHMLDNIPPLTNPLFPPLPGQSSVSNNVPDPVSGNTALSVYSEERNKLGKKLKMPIKIKSRK